MADLGQGSKPVPPQSQLEIKALQEDQLEIRQTQGMEKEFRPPCGEQHDKGEGVKKAGL